MFFRRSYPFVLAWKVQARDLIFEEMASICLLELWPRSMIEKRTIQILHGFDMKFMELTANLFPQGSLCWLLVVLCGFDPYINLKFRTCS